MGHEVDQLAVELIHGAEEAIAEPDCAGGDHV